jgi:hypothetical protein
MLRKSIKINLTFVQTSFNFDMSLMSDNHKVGNIVETGFVVH